MDSTYLQNAANMLAAIGIALTATLTRKLTKAASIKDPIDALLVEQSYNFNITRDYWVTAEIARILSPLIAEDAPKLRLRVNSWIARSRLGEDTSEEIRQWDVSALTGPFQLAKLVLQDDIDGAHDMAKKLMASNQLTTLEYREWPLFESVRAKYPM